MNNIPVLNTSITILSTASIKAVSGASTHTPHIIKTVLTVTKAAD